MALCVCPPEFSQRSLHYRNCFLLNCAKMSWDIYLTKLLEYGGSTGVICRQNGVIWGKSESLEIVVDGLVTLLIRLRIRHLLRRKYKRWKRLDYSSKIQPLQSIRQDPTQKIKIRRQNHIPLQLHHI